MNIFAVSRHPRKCARALDDKRLNKMILETAQILCTVMNQQDGRQSTPYKSSHVNHPITKWAKDIHHQRWLYALGLAYGEEIMYRFNRKHACLTVIEDLAKRNVYLTMCDHRLSIDQFYNGARHQTLGLDFTHLRVDRAYRAYLNARWPGDKRKPVWTRRSEPSWRS